LSLEEALRAAADSNGGMKTRTGKSVDALPGNTANERSFNVPARESRTYAGRHKVPDDGACHGRPRTLTT
jgi:hypothetical protein